MDQSKQVDCGGQIILPFVDVGPVQSFRKTGQRGIAYTGVGK